MTDSNNQLDQIDEVELNQETVDEAIAATESATSGNKLESHKLSILSASQAA